MRRFIYLDTETLNSYLAQIFDGLIQSHEHENVTAKKTDKQEKTNGSLKSQAKLTLFGKGVEAEAEAAYERLKTLADENTVRDVQTKILHDNAFNEFEKYIKEKKLLDGEEIGSFISVKDDFYIFDVAFYKKLFAENGFVSGLLNLQKEEIKKKVEQEAQNLSREQQRNKDTQKRIKEIISSATSENEKSFATIEKMVNLLDSIIPYPQVMCISKYLVTLNDKYLRDDLSTAAFKYGGKIKMVGYITNRVVSQENSQISVFSNVTNSINEIMKLFFENAGDMYIVHPIAIYYDN